MLQSGRIITAGNSFSSYGLAEELLKNSLAYIGTLRKNRGEIPANMLPNRKHPIHSSLLGFHKFTVVCHVPKVNKAVVLLATLHHDQLTADDEQKKLAIVTMYNQTKVGVETLDKMFAWYTCIRSSRRWPVILFFALLNITGVNAFVIWIERNPSWKCSKSGKLPSDI